MEQKSTISRYSKALSRLGISSVALGVVAGLVKAWAEYWLGPASMTRGHEPPPQPQVTAVLPAEAAARPTTIDDLLRSSPISLTQWQVGVEAQYRDRVDRERMFREYTNREVIWEGYFDKFHPVVFEPNPQRAFTAVIHESRAAIYSEQVLGPPFIRCWFPESARNRLSSLKQGQWVVIRGRLSNPNLLGEVLCTDLEPCEILTVRDARDVSVAVETSPSATVTR